MKVFRPINNNIVSAFDNNGREVVVIGKGIGYKAREGNMVPPEKIDKVFVMSNQNNIDQLVSLFTSLPIKYIEVTDEILTFAKQHLNKTLNESAYFTLADHINFAVYRRKQGMDFQNVLFTEIRRFYTKEFEVGLHALRLMKEKLGIDMPEDEAASIALHILNAEYDVSISEAFHATQLLKKIIAIVTKETGCVIDSSNFYCERFITHLKFLTQRIIRNESAPETDDTLLNILADQYPNKMLCCGVITAEVQKTHNYSLSKGEATALIVHLIRIDSQVTE